MTSSATSDRDENGYARDSSSGVWKELGVGYNFAFELGFEKLLGNDLDPDVVKAIDAFEVVDNFTLITEEALVRFKFITTEEVDSTPGTTLRTNIYSDVQVKGEGDETVLFREISERSSTRRSLSTL
jgi:hypothetical protein